MTNFKWESMGDIQMKQMQWHQWITIKNSKQTSVVNNDKS